LFILLFLNSLQPAVQVIPQALIRLYCVLSCHTPSNLTVSCLSAPASLLLRFVEAVVTVLLKLVTLNLVFDAKVVTSVS
jgi:hypothetical protein